HGETARMCTPPNRSWPRLGKDNDVEDRAIGAGPPRGPRREWSSRRREPHRVAEDRRLRSRAAESAELEGPDPRRPACRGIPRTVRGRGHPARELSDLRPAVDREGRTTMQLLRTFSKGDVRHGDNA